MGRLKYMTTEKLKKVNWKLVTILLVAFILRVWNLNVNPPSLSSDEAALGYNAYSILKTGKDEYGKLLPIIFKSFGDYKPGLCVYLTVPFVFLFGLNEWSVRLPSALAGVVGVYLLYSIVKKFIDYDFLQVETKVSSRSLALISSLIFALAPWHVYFSRGGWEANISLTLTLAGIYFFIKALKNNKFLIFSSVFFALTFIAYQGAKLATTIVLFTLAVLFWKNCIGFFKDCRKTLFFAFVLASLIASPSILSFSQGQTGRLTVFSVFSYPRPVDYIEKMLFQNNEKIGDLNYLLFHNEPLNYTRAILGRYFNHFSARFLFFDGDYQNPKHSSPNQGMLMFYDLLLLPFGFYYLGRSKGAFKKFILLLLLLTPLPAVLTRDQVQAVRALNMIVPLTLVSSLGGLSLIIFFRRLFKNSKAMASIAIVAFLFILTTSLVYFLDSYFIHQPIHNAKYWNWGYKQIIKTLLPIQDNYKIVYFQQGYDQPYIYYLFYSRYDPKAYQKQAKLSYYLGPDVGLVETLDNIDFAGWSWPFATGEKSTLTIGNGVAIPSDFSRKDYNLISEIKYPDNFMTAFRIVETK